MHLSNQNLYNFTATDVVPCEGPHTSHHHHRSADYIFWSFGVIEFILVNRKKYFFIKPVLGGVAGDVKFITCHEQIQ